MASKMVIKFKYLTNRMLEEELKQETEKWLKRIKAERKKIALVDDDKENIINNIDSYISDSEHFLQKNDLIRAFEAVTYAWGILETIKNLGIIREG